VLQVFRDVAALAGNGEIQCNGQKSMINTRATVEKYNLAATTVTPVQMQAVPVWRSMSYFVLIAAVYLFPLMRILMQGTDEGELIDGAVRIVHGQVFARDFLEVMGPGTFYWLAFFFKLFGVTFLATRICLFLTSLGTAFLMYFLSRRLCVRHAALPCALLAGVYFGVLWPAISHHADSNFFALISIVCVVLWQENKKGISFASCRNFSWNDNVLSSASEDCEPQRANYRALSGFAL